MFIYLFSIWEIKVNILLHKAWNVNFNQFCHKSKKKIWGRPYWHKICVQILLVYIANDQLQSFTVRTLARKKTLHNSLEQPVFQFSTFPGNILTSKKKNTNTIYIMHYLQLIRNYQISRAHRQCIGKLRFTAFQCTFIEFCSSNTFLLKVNCV